MKVQVKQIKPASKVKFPSLWENKIYAGLVVLLKGPQVGVVVSGGESTLRVGYYFEHWNIQDFTLFNGTVTLEND